MSESGRIDDIAGLTPGIIFFTPAWPKVKIHRTHFALRPDPPSIRPSRVLSRGKMDPKINANYILNWLSRIQVGLVIQFIKSL